jgi:hypothetical protein
MSRLAGALWSRCMLLTRKQIEIIARQAMYPGQPLFNIGAAIDIDGPLDLQRFLDSDCNVRRRDVALRRALELGGAEPALVALEEVTPAEVIDLSAHVSPEEAAREWIDRSFAQSFAFDGKTVLLRHEMLRLCEDKHIFLAAYHHVAYDGWSTSIHYQRLVAEYNRVSVREIEPLSLEEQVLEEQAYRESRRFAQDEEYWRSRYDGYETRLFPDLRKSALSARRHSFSLSAQRYAALGRIATQSGATLFHVMTCAVAAYLFRMFGVDDVVIGLPILNRSTARAKRTYGMFVNVLPFRLSIGPRTTFTELMASIGTAL